MALVHPQMYADSGPQRGVVSCAAHAYTLPALGYDEQISAITQPEMMVKKLHTIHPQMATAGPPSASPVEKHCDSDAITATDVKQNAKEDIALKPRYSVCLYPRRFSMRMSSSDSSEGADMVVVWWATRRGVAGRVRGARRARWRNWVGGCASCD